jgi:hypothetical protein
VNNAASAPWSRRDLLRAAVLNALGLAAILGGWIWASGRNLLGDQFPAANLTVVGLILAGAGNISWLLSGRRAVGRAKLVLFGPRVDGP